MTALENRQESIHIALVGDSDIEQWPPSLLPFFSPAQSTTKNITTTTTTTTHAVAGTSGATLQEILPLVETELGRHYQTNHDKEQEEPSATTSLLLIVCAGENDISTGIPLPETLQSLDRLLELVTEASEKTNAAVQKNKKNAKKPPPTVVHLVFLGPKLEPWLVYDDEARKDYIRMSQQMEQRFELRSPPDYCYYMDCLTLFCGDTKKLRGALWGGQAKALECYFDYDQVHLSCEGYDIWKTSVEQHVATQTTIL